MDDDDDAERERFKLYSRMGGEGRGVFYAEGTTTAGDGSVFPENGELGSRERDRTGKRNGGRTTDSVASDPSVSNFRSAPLEDLEAKSTTTTNHVAEPETTQTVPLVYKHPCGAERTYNGDVVSTENPAVSEAPLRDKLKDGRRRCPSSASDETRHTLEIDPTSSWESISSLDDGAGAISEGRERDGGEGAAGDGSVATAGRRDSDEAMGADDFLPLFALVLVSFAAD